MFLVLAVIFMLRFLYNQKLKYKTNLLGYNSCCGIISKDLGNHQKIFKLLSREEVEVVTLVLLLAI